ncbi:MAG: exopolysaccharide biosynthesis polyprenyl glycosylphosphotransferase [Hyphomicrobiales bacterium]|nr:exopolysaccharide biosynthesis polyprenyl glycosylphosphotransferase [Hyphomicrobiales bacterium]
MTATDACASKSLALAGALAFSRDTSADDGRLGRRRFAATRAAFSVLAAMTDFAAILLAYCLADYGYITIVHGAQAACVASARLGVFAASIFVILNLGRHRYTISDYLDMSGHAQRTFAQWNVAFLAAATFGFLVRAIEDSSRGAFIVFYAVGLFSLYAGRAALVLYARRDARAGRVLASRTLIVGFEKDIEAFRSQRQPEKRGISIVATRQIDEDAPSRSRVLVETVDLARRLMPDDIVVAVPWERSEVIDECVTAFMRVPASLHLHLDPDCPLNRFAKSGQSGRDAITGFRLNGYAMTGVGGAAKRAADIVLAGLGLLLLSPLFLLVAVAIRIDSKGPALFFQTRHGFNKAPFRIFKFRTMSAAEDGAAVRQATRDDPRITRIGRILRRFNIDELPQLLNVLRGDMSLVGPRPHAVVHDQAFEPEVVLYARRHNVKPGITGWAQVNGLRGETTTPEKIARRVQYDLDYIDNWSFVLDIWIIFLTLFSRKAYANAG